MPRKNRTRKRLSARERRDLDIEIGFLEGVVQREPDYIEALQVLGDDYTRRRKFDAGLKVDLRLSQLRPEDALVHYNLACSYSLRNRPDEALSALTRALELGYRDLAWLRRDPDLAKIRHHPQFREILARLKRIEFRAP
jgi:tetratricopeptide (TPR) repeat protein